MKFWVVSENNGSSNLVDATELPHVGKVVLGVYFNNNILDEKMNLVIKNDNYSQNCMQFFYPKFH